MTELKCPFCKEELSYAQEIDGGFEILTCDCPHGIWLFGNDKMWYNLEKAITELDRTRKALNFAISTLTVISEGCVIEHSVVGHEDDNKIKLAKIALDKIKTALEQKDVK